MCVLFPDNIIPSNTIIIDECNKNGNPYSERSLIYSNFLYTKSRKLYDISPVMMFLLNGDITRLDVPVRYNDHVLPEIRNIEKIFGDMMDPPSDYCDGGEVCKVFENQYFKVSCINRDTFKSNWRSWCRDNLHYDNRALNSFEKTSLKPLVEDKYLKFASTTRETKTSLLTMKNLNVVVCVIKLENIDSENPQCLHLHYLPDVEDGHIILPTAHEENIVQNYDYQVRIKSTFCTRPKSESTWNLLTHYVDEQCLLDEGYVKDGNIMYKEALGVPGVPECRYSHMGFVFEHAKQEDDDDDNDSGTNIDSTLLGRLFFSSNNNVNVLIPFM